MTTTLDLSVPWTPHLGGKPLSPCSLTSKLDKMEVVPDPRSESEVNWCRVSVVDVMPNNLKEEGAMLEAILQLWRLLQVRSEGLKDRGWQKHLRAWEVCSLDVLRSVVTDETD